MIPVDFLVAIGLTNDAIAALVDQIGDNGSYDTFSRFVATDDKTLRSSRYPIVIVGCHTVEHFTIDLIKKIKTNRVSGCFTINETRIIGNTRECSTWVGSKSKTRRSQLDGTTRVTRLCCFLV